MWSGSVESLAIIFGLASAASWGAGDFSGGLATRRTPVFTVLILSQIVGGVMLATLALVLVETLPAAGTLVLGGVAGACGGFGLVALYTGLARGQMGVVAPVAAVVTAILPVIVGFVAEGLPAIPQVAGFAFALLAVWLLSSGGGGAGIRWRDLRLPVLAGVAFGLFYILIDRVSSEAILWPLVAARIAAVVLLSIVALAGRFGGRPARTMLPLIALAGIFDTGGNAFFALATRVGRLDIATVLGSLYPATTVLLAWLLLNERLVLRQWLGVGIALLALVLIAAG